MSSHVSTHPVPLSLCLATMYYRQALQLVPDIESRVSHGEEGGRTEEEEEEDERGGVSRVLLAGQGGSPVENGLQKVSTERVCRCVG